MYKCKSLTIFHKPVEILKQMLTFLGGIEMENWRRSEVCIINFDLVLQFFPVFLLFNLNK